MKLLPTLLFFVYLILTSPVSGQKIISLSSPDGNIHFSFNIVNKSMNYSVAFKGKTIIDNSSLSLKFDKDNFQNNLKIDKTVYHDTTEDYDLIVGKTKHVHTQYKEVTIPVEETVSPFRKINLVVKAFNDGLAFRYELQKEQNQANFVLLDENTTFKLTGDPVVHALLLPNYTTSHEGTYSILPLSKVKEDTLMDMPALFELPGKIFIGITEAALLDYAGMYLSKHDGVLRSRLSPLPNQTDIKVKATLPHNSPWRVMLISDRIGSLIESNIITTLNEPCKIKDVSWIKPGKTTFPWWNGNVVPDTLNAPGNNFVTNQYYIDFCARNHIEYHSVVEYGLHQWYTDDGVGFQPGPHSDVTKPVPGLDMKEICDYAKTKGVDVRVWVHFYALYPKLDTAFAIFEKWGLKGMMVDFMDRDDQEMVNMQTEILQKAAAHHLHIQFHGAYKPTGLSRTYPNEFTREGTRNYEVDKWDANGISPDHDINMPFTRGLAGSTDYHLGGFRAVPQDKYRAQYTRPLVLGTRCHMLAMYVVLENYLQMVCDYPAAYEGEAGFEFIKEIPTTWDETKVIDAKVDNFILIARKKNNDWYVGAINNHEARQMDISFNFLGEGKYEAEIYSDAKDTNENPNHLIMQKRMVTQEEHLSIKLAAGGGTVMRLRKQ
ncbi:MAG: glycoside hydrolase family 97 protein [Bacteroidota bacterium]|nr:glycoside hydrolase family 97 protein [Bacteroidota bacterium]